MSLSEEEGEGGCILVVGVLAMARQGGKSAGVCWCWCWWLLVGEEEEEEEAMASYVASRVVCVCVCVWMDGAVLVGGREEGRECCFCGSVVWGLWAFYLYI
jgi:hypothetical protein